MSVPLPDSPARARVGVPPLAVRGLARTYGEGPTAIAALAGVDLDFPAGTFTAVMGPSGSGKTTLLTCAAGLDQPTAGQVLLDGEDVSHWDEGRRTLLRRDRIGFVFQDFALMPYLTARENVGLPLRLAGRRPDPAGVSRLLDGVGLADRSDHLPGQLSGGQQQRVAVARALLTDPAVILADEPTGALDSHAARGVLDLLRGCVDGTVSGHRQTVVMVTHDPVAAARSDRVVFLVDGRVAGRMDSPTADAVAGQLANLEELGAGEGVA